MPLAAKVKSRLMSAARTLGMVAVVSKSKGVGFTLETPPAVGTETYDYIVIR